MNFVESIYKFNKERNLLNGDYKLSSEIGFIYEEISEGLKRFNDDWEFIDSLGDIIVFATGSILKLFNGDKDKAEKLIANTAKNILVDRKTQLLGRDLLKLCGTEVYDCDVLCLYDVIEQSIGDSQLPINDRMKFHIYGDLGEKLSYVTQLLSKGKIESDDDRCLIAIYFATIISLTLHYLRLVGYNPFKVLDEIMKQNFSRKGKIDEKSGKWVKDKNQDPNTLYKPDFENARL